MGKQIVVYLFRQMLLSNKKEQMTCVEGSKGIIWRWNAQKNIVLNS